MRLVATNEVEDGTRVARDVMTGRSDAIPLLRAGARMTCRFRDALVRAGVTAVYVDDELSAGIEVHELVSEEVRRQATKAVSTAFEATRDGVSGGKPFPEKTVNELQRVAEMIALEVQETGDVALALSDLSAGSSYTLQHSIDVAALGLLLGQRLFHQRGWLNYRRQYTWERIDRRLTLLGLGLLLHDVGKLTIPPHVVEKPGKLDEEEWALMKTHPLAGVELLRSSTISPLVKIVVRSHHERYGGGGYPDGLVGDKIHELARIASVADVYDAVTSERVYAPAKPPHVGVEVITDGAGSAFDPEVVEVFRELVVPYPPGIEVALSDGRRGIVASVPPDSLDRPVVRIAWDPSGAPADRVELPLAGCPGLEIADAGFGAGAKPTGILSTVV